MTREDSSRRSVLRRLGAAVGGGVVGSVGLSTRASASQTFVRGRIEEAGGRPAADDPFNPYATNHSFEETYLRIGKGGQYRIELRGPDSLYLGYYQAEPGYERVPAPARDGSPDIFDLFSAIEVTEGPTNLGTFTLPEAHLLHVEVLDSSGAPVRGAEVRVVHSRGGGGYGSGRHTTNEDGLLEYPDADYAGTELVGNVTIELWPPGADAGAAPAERRSIELAAPRTETFYLE